MRFSTAELRLLAAVPLRPLQFALYFLSGYASRRDDLWVFGSWGGRRFADNTAAFFAFCHQQISSSIDLVWISRDRGIVRRLRRGGFEAHWVWSPRGIARCLRAGVYVTDCFTKDINHWLSRGAKNANLWSGVPLKTFERDIDNPRNRYYRLFHGSPLEKLAFGAMMPWHLDRPELIIATSEETAEITRRAFDVPERSVAVTGFPRNDSLLAGGSIVSMGVNAFPEEVRRAADARKPIFLYLPTFRDSGNEFIEVDWRALDDLMERLDAMFFVKFHPVDAARAPYESSRIVQLDQRIEVYDILPEVTALVSDYSSVIFDFLLLDRPIIYYVPDLDEFLSTSRSLNFDPRELSAGPFCTTSEELLEAVAAIGVAGPFDEAAVAREKIRRRLHRYDDGESSERVLAAIDSRLIGGLLGSTRRTS